MIAAVLFGPILAIQVQKCLETIKEKKARRLSLFHNLMATRGARVSQVHVQSLNMIDIEFYGKNRLGSRYQSKSEKAVTNAWKNYNDHLNNTAFGNSHPDNWIKEGDELLAKLLFEMSNALGYDFDEVDLKRNHYSPMAHGERELQTNAIMKGLSDIFLNNIPVPIHMVDANKQL